MSNKLVHVNAYEREDGTPVREHWRGGPPNAVLNGGVQYDDYITTPEKALDVARLIATVTNAYADLAGNAINIVSQIKSSGQDNLIPHLKSTIDYLLEIQTASENLSQNTLNRLTSTNDQKEYSELLNAYTKQKEFNDRNKAALNRIQTYLNDNNLDGVYKELQNYKNFNNTSNIDAKDELNNPHFQHINENFKDHNIPNQQNIMWSDAFKDNWHKKPEKEKSFLMNILDAGKIFAPDAYELGKISANNFERSEEYINQNGIVIEHIDDLPFDENFKSTIREKVQKQIQMNDAKGIVFMPSSRLSKNIKNSLKFKHFIRKNIVSLAQGENVQGSINFDFWDSQPNLYASLKCVSILNSYINEKGDIVAFVFDTYDFNPNSNNPYVEMAYNVQKNNMFTNFYTINIIVIPAKKIFMWLEE